MANGTAITNKPEIFGLSERFNKIYSEVYELFPPDNGKPELRYRRRNWIFPQHFDIMLEQISCMCTKYGGDREICSLAAVLHDTGLVYKRVSPGPDGHEERSIEYSKALLLKYDFDSDKIDQILKCISATDRGVTPDTTNAKIVRTADALSKFLSCHFIAKAAFSIEDFDEYIPWLADKVESSYMKICFDDEKKDAEHAYRYLRQAVSSYLAQK
jgi:hypothetical protein